MRLADSWRYPHADPSVHLFDEAVRRWDVSMPKSAVVVELGCCETDFCKWLKEARPDVTLTGIDPNAYADYQGAFVQASATDVDFAPGSLDAVIALGSLEHFGLGFYGDPVQPDADIETMRKVATWLKPGGWCYYDVPYTPGTYYVTENRHFRVYDDAALQTRIEGGLQPVHRAYAHGHTDIWQDIKPDAPTVPFWYCIRLLEKRH